MRRKSIVAGLTGWYVFSTFVLLILCSGYLYWSLSKTLNEQDRAILEKRFRTISFVLKESQDPIAELSNRLHSEWLAQSPYSIFVRVLSPTGKVLVETGSMPEEVVHEVFSNAASGYIKARSGHAYFKKVENNIELALDLNHQQVTLSKYQNELVFVLGTALLMSAIIGVRISRAGFKPVQNMTDLAARIRPDRLHERIPEEELSIELVSLAKTINEMLNRLEEAFNRLSRFSSDIAHELRTPINNFKGELEVALSKSRSVEEYREVLSSALEESDRISRIIDSLLFLARAENPRTQIQKEWVDLNQEVKKLVEFYEPIAGDSGISIDSLIPNEIKVEVEKTLFQRALGNILANAINYTPSGGRVRIQGEEQRGKVCLAISDTGEGIAESHLPLIFDRFYRTDESRTATKLGGFGLGLTIVKSILKLHGGEIQIKSQLNQGTEVYLYFPKQITDS